MATPTRSSAMVYQYKREPLTADEANRLANACVTHHEKLVIWTLLDLGLRVGEFAALTRQNIDWQAHRLTVYGKGGLYGARSKRRGLPLNTRVRAILEAHIVVTDTLGLSIRSISRLVERMANRAAIARPTSPHVLRHTFAVAAVQKGISLPALQPSLATIISRRRRST